MSERKPPIVKSNVIFFVAVNLAGLVVAPIYGLTVGFTGAAWALMAVLLVLSGLSITARLSPPVVASDLPGSPAA